MNLFIWAIVGLVAGTIAKAIYPGSQGGGIISTIILGVVGAFAGGTIFTLLNTGTFQVTASGAGLSISGLFVAVLGSIVTIFLWNLLNRSNV
jgi:uncharacterized membrane protein YeaQ/YmgE (transglycosylase-associated protein family)